MSQDPRYLIVNADDRNTGLAAATGEIVAYIEAVEAVEAYSRITLFLRI